MIKNIFFDRDGIINEVVLRNSKIESPRFINEFKIKDDFINFYTGVSKKNICLFIISNQPDISRKLLTQEELELMNNQLKNNYVFKDIQYCPHDDSDNCNCRKPKPGMILNLLEKHNLNKEESIYIGDGWKDIEAGKKAGVKTVLLSQEYNSEIKSKPDYQVNSLMDLLSLSIWGSK